MPGINQARSDELIRWKFSTEPHSELVRSLNSSITNRQVIDETGLTGSYDFTAENPDRASNHGSREAIGLETRPPGRTIDELDQFCR
jgi:uncharacterized protein (TIGR03435 family)